MPKQLERGQKVEHVRQVIAKFGKECSFAQAKAFLKQQYGYDLSESTFYNERKRSTTPSATPAVVAKAPEKTAPIDMGGILELVDAGQRLVKSLGKDRAKELIDKL